MAARRCALTGEAVSRAEPGGAPYVIWDDRLTGFGVRVSPGGTKAFFVQYRTGDGRRTDRNRKLTLGRYPGLSPGSARKRAQALLGRARDGRDPSRERALARGMPSVGEAVEAWLGTRNVSDASLQLYQRSAQVWLKGWIGRRLDEVTREDVARRFAEVTEGHGKVKANLGLFVLGGTYRRSAVDHPGLRDPVERWKHAGGRAHRLGRRRIEHPELLLPAWDQGLREGVRRPEVRDYFRFGLYTGMRRGEVLALRWDQVAFEEGKFVVDETKTGEPLELPVTRQLRALLARRFEARPKGSVGVRLTGQSRAAAQPPRQLLSRHHPPWRQAVLVPRTSQLLRHGRRPRAQAPQVAGQAPGQPPRSRRSDGGVCDAVDARAAS